MKEKTKPLAKAPKITPSTLHIAEEWAKNESHPFLINLTLWDYFTDTYHTEESLINSINRYFQTFKK
jgi:hypothetical protein